MYMVGLSLESWKPLMLMLSTLIGKRVFECFCVQQVTCLLDGFLGSDSMQQYILRCWHRIFIFHFAVYVP